MPRHYRMLLVIALGAAVWAMPTPAGVEPQGWRLLAIF
ncbi:MAG: anion permease, partial [Acidobacteria bacterium]|nr:anion permease [Acidobacteriota bacterium]